MRFSIIALGLICNLLAADARYTPIKGSSTRIQTNDLNEFRRLGVGTSNNVGKEPKQDATKEPKPDKDNGKGAEDDLDGNDEDEDESDNESLPTLSPANPPIQSPTSAPVMSPTLKPSLDEDQASHTPIIVYPDTPTAPSSSPFSPTIIITNPDPPSPSTPSTPSTPTPGTPTTSPVFDPNPDPPSPPTPSTPTPGTPTTSPVSDPNPDPPSPSTPSTPPTPTPGTPTSSPVSGPNPDPPSPSTPSTPTPGTPTTSPVFDPNPDPQSPSTPSTPTPGTPTTSPVSDPNQPSVSRPSVSDPAIPTMPTEASSTRPSAVPSTGPSAMPSVATIARGLLPFDITLEGESEQFVNVEEALKLSLEFFLEEKFGEVFDGVTSVRLQEDDGIQSIQRQAVQKTFGFEGNANFENSNVPTLQEVHRVQQSILEDFLFEFGGILQDNGIELDPTSVTIDEDTINTADDDFDFPFVGSDDSIKQVLDDDGNDIIQASGGRGIGQDDDDDDAAAIWIGLAAACLVLLVGFFVAKRRRPNELDEELSVHDEENLIADTSEPKPLTWDGVFRLSSMGFEELEGSVPRPETEFMNVPQLEERQVVTLKNVSGVSKRLFQEGPNSQD